MFARRARRRSPVRRPRSPFLLLVSAFAVPALAAVPETAAEAPLVVFMEPVEPGATGGEANHGELPLFREVEDPGALATYRRWLDNPAARYALDLYAQARRIAIERDPDAAQRQPAAYFVALVPEGNHGDLGFRLIRGSEGTSGEEDRSRTAYIRLGPDEWRFDTTFLHETGHVVVYLLSGGRKLEGRPMAAIPHSTAALSDRETAFREGYAIHLETLMARLDTRPDSRNRYFHEEMLFGEVASAPRKSEYHRGLVDLLSFAQSIARYHEVAENTFAFRSAWTGPDYLRIQLEKGRDFSELRSADELLQAEGFYASFFYGILFRGTGTPSAGVLAERQARMLAVLGEVLDVARPEPNRPYLLDLLDAYRKLFPETYPEVLDVFLDLSHGVFVDPEARERWRRAYLGALRLDMEAVGLAELEERRRDWRRRVLADPAVLRARIGPEIPCEVPGVTVELVAFGEPLPLYFDLNTAEPGVLALVPGLGEEARARLLAEREARPFAGVEDFERRVGVTGAGLECGGS